MKGKIENTQAAKKTVVHKQSVEPYTLKKTAVELGVPLMIIAVLALITQVYGDYLFLNIDEVNAGEWWRVLSSQWAHLNVLHALENTVGLVLIYFVFRLYMTRTVWLLSLALLPLADGLAIYLLDSDVLQGQYAGLSGALHGLLMVGLFYAFRHMKLITLIMLAVIVGRVYLEQQPGYNIDYLKDVIAGSVYVNAHLYGIICGISLGVLFKITEYIRFTNNLNSRTTSIY